MAKIKEYGYVQFPLCLLMETYTNAQAGLTMIEDFAIVKFAKTFSYNINEVGRQLMYGYYRKKDIMPKKLLDMMEDYINKDELTIDEDYNGFSGSEFEPLECTSELIGLFETNEDFKDDAILYYQIKQAIDSKCLSIIIYDMDSLLKGYETGCKIKREFEAQFGPDAIVSVKITQLFEFRKTCKDLDLFRAFLAIKSMIGTKAFAEGNKPTVLSRMIGCKSKEAFEYYTTKKNCKSLKVLETVDKYNKRYHMDKLLLELAERKFIMHLPIKGCRFIYFSKFMDTEELVKLIHAKKANSMELKIKNAAMSL